MNLTAAHSTGVWITIVRRLGLSRSIIAPAERVTNLRWGIAVLVALGILIVSFDWVALAVSGPALHAEFGIDDIGMGYLFSIFGWAYAIAQIPFGVLLDRFGVMPTGRVWSICWGLIGLATTLAGSFAAFLGLRVALGIAQAPAYPVSAKAIGYWFPRRERGMATAFLDAASKIAIGFGIPLMVWLVTAHGWRAAFTLTGALGVVYSLLFFVMYKDPTQFPALTHAEKQHLGTGGAQAEGAADPAVNILALKQVWALTIGFFAYSFAFYLLLTWMPTFFFRTYGMRAIYANAYATIPWLISALAALFVGGAVIDGLVSRGEDETRVRKTVLVIGMLLGLAVAAATWMQGAFGAVIVMCVALAGLGMSGPVVWSLPALIAPRGTAGRVAAMMNCGGAFGAIVAPIAAGYVASATGGFQVVFYMTTLVMLIGVAGFTFFLGPIAPADGTAPGLTI
jgi:ACS family D-galactonate transporter-like MFS transporter